MASARAGVLTPRSPTGRPPCRSSCPWHTPPPCWGRDRGSSPVTLGGVPARPRVTALALLLLMGAAACSGGSDRPGRSALAKATIGPATGTPSASSSGGPSPSPSPSKAIAGKPSGATVTLAFAGDVHFEGGARQALGGGLSDIAPLLSRADLTMVNLETAVSNSGSPNGGKKYTFRAPPAAFGALKRAGVDVVTMANNHGLDYGQQALADSLAASHEFGVPVVGAGKDADAAFAPHIATSHGVRVAFLGATQVLDDNLAASWTAGRDHPGLASAKDVDRLVAAVRQARTQADVVVVDLHWGTELAACPTEAQRSLAPRLAEAGADVIGGSHAHVLRGGGWLGRAYVDYGLGNFVFYARTPQTEQSGVLTLTLTGRSVTSADWSPARIRSGLPRPLSGDARQHDAGVKARLGRCTGLAPTPPA